MKIFVVGSGIAGISFLENLKSPEESRQIFIVEKNKTPFRKAALIDWLTDGVRDNDFFVRTQGLEDRFASFEIINDKAVRVNFDKKKIFFKEKPALDFDKLFLSCGSSPQLVDFAGRYKRGVYYLSDCDPLELKDIIHVYPNIVIYADTVYGLDLVKKLIVFKDKDIKLLVPSSLDFLSPEDKQAVLGFLKDNNIDVYLGQHITEALGESRIRAVKLSSGKFLACDNLVLDTRLFPDNSIIKDHPHLFWQGGVKVDDQFRLNDNEDCFICGDMINRKGEQLELYTSAESKAREQAKSIAGRMFNT